MRLATKNEILILLGQCAPGFAAFCVSDAGATTRFLFDNTSNFDLESDLVQTMVTGLNQAGIIDEAAAVRLAGFGIIPVVPPLPGYRTYRAPIGDPVPPGAVAVIDTTDPTVLIITVEVTP